ncbi:spinster family MFS transporter [Sphingobium lignivorans]|uniref:MFS family permease n=1 Tax=Sphingobium lignivorans TaxID=2735886 RepID=A0ABR6NHL1_9SPHN|nr:MFS transporter [Sphingobium lignivorans]MBB5986772.1 MFS family permease [Sphingobium lignivorans]
MSGEATQQTPPGWAEPGGDWTPISIYTLVVVTIIYALSFLDRSILSIVLPLIKQELHISDTMLGLITGFAFVLLYSGLGVPIARLADRGNRRNILALGCAAWSLMTVLTGAVTNVAQLALTRFLMGAAEAAGIAPTTAMLSDRFGPRGRPLALSIMTSGSGLSALLMLPVAGYIAQHHGWRSAYFVAGSFGIVIAILLFLTVPEPQRLGKDGKADAPSFGTVWAWLRTRRSFGLMCASGACLAVTTYAMITWTPTFLMRVHGLTPGEAAAAFGPIRGLSSIVGVIGGGALAGWAARRNPRWLLLLPAIGAAISVPAELLFLLSDDLPIALTGLGLASLAGAMHFGPSYAAMVAIVPPSMRATTAAIFLFCVNMVGQIIGPLAIGWLNDRWAGLYGDEAVRYSMIVATICVVIASILMVLASGRLRDDLEAARIFTPAKGPTP